MTAETRPADTEEEDVAAAIIAAKRIAKRWSYHKGRYRELLGAAWIGVRRARKAGYNKGYLFYKYAYDSVVEHLRSDKPLGLSRRQHAAGMPPVENLGDAVWVVPSREVRHQSPDEVWAEYAPSRRLVPLQWRVMAYLYLVGGMLLREVAELFGACESRVWLIIDRFKALVRMNKEPACYDHSTRKPRG